MYKHVNSASRLHALLSALLALPENTQMYSAWAKVFGLSAPNDQRLGQAVVERPHWVHYETELLAQQLHESGISEHLYESALTRIEGVTSALQLSTPWQSLKGNLTPDVVLALAFCNELLPDEEQSIAGDELQAIDSQVRELLEMLKSSALPPAVQKLIGHHLELIQQALARYPIQGAKALREAGRTALGELIESKESVASSKGSPEVSKLEKLWKHVNVAADTAMKAERVAQLGQRAWDAVQGFIQ